jgi:hypothetical protein
VTHSVSIPDLQCMDVEAWRIPTKEEMRAYIDSLNKHRNPSVLAIRETLSPFDVYCYLKARFGKPNGFQTFLRSDSSDNLIHWDFILKAGTQDVHISGASREIHFVLSERLTDSDWRILITKIKADYKRIGKTKSAITRSLEKWVIFPNRFVAVANICADLHAEIVSNIGSFQTYKPSTTKIHEAEEVLRKLAQRADTTYRACLELSLLTPIMAEAFINMLILILCKREIRDNPRQFEAFIRAQIDTKIFDLPYKCAKFTKMIDQHSAVFKNFKRVMDKRNHAIHGNIDPEKERVEIVYFDEKTPLFPQSGDRIFKFFEALERQHDPEAVIKDYEDTHTFLLEIINCIHPEIINGIWEVIEDRYPGYDLGRKITGRLFPDHVATGYLEGLKYDDELEW